jgi:hypothetical protein
MKMRDIKENINSRNQAKELILHRSYIAYLTYAFDNII